MCRPTRVPSRSTRSAPRPLSSLAGAWPPDTPWGASRSASARTPSRLRFCIRSSIGPSRPSSRCSAATRIGAARSRATQPPARAACTDTWRSHASATCAAARNSTSSASRSWTTKLTARGAACGLSRSPEDCTCRSRVCRLDGKFTGYAGLSYFLFRDGRHGPTTISARVAGQEVGRYEHHDETGWHGFRFDTTRFAGQTADVEFTVDSDDPDDRQLCFYADTR